ncbi:MAG: Gldg family protein [Eubacteriales bacterium]
MSHIKDNLDELSQGDISKEKQKKSVDKRAKSLRFFSIGSVIFIIAILLVVNLLFDSIFSGKLSWDLTSLQVNSISDVSKGIVSKMNKDVEIVGLFELTKDAEKNYADFIPVLKDYAAKSNGHITVRFVDPVKYPSIITELDPQKAISPAAGSFVVKCGDKLKLINPSDCFTYDEQTYYQTGSYVATSNNVEYNFTGAISAVTSDVVTKAYFTTNHKESSHVQLNTLLSNNGMEVADVSTVEITAIPDDCSLLIIDDPLEDISTPDISLLTGYLGKGGKLIVISGYESANLTFPNLNEVLHTMNLNISNSRISENDMTYRIQATSGYMGYADIPAGTFAPAAYGKALVLADMRAISVFDNPKSYIATEPVITSSASALLEANGDPAQTGVAGVQNIAMYSANSGGKAKSEAVVIGTTYLTSDEYISQYSLNDQNVAFFSSIALKLTGTVNNVQVEVKQIPNYKFTSAPTANTQGIWSIALIVVLPMTFIIIGVVIYKKRKNL